MTYLFCPPFYLSFGLSSICSESPTAAQHQKVYRISVPSVPRRKSTITFTSSSFSACSNPTTYSWVGITTPSSADANVVMYDLLSSNKFGWLSCWEQSTKRLKPCWLSIVEGNKIVMNEKTNHTWGEAPLMLESQRTRYHTKPEIKFSPDDLRAKSLLNMSMHLLAATRDLRMW